MVSFAWPLVFLALPLPLLVLRLAPAPQTTVGPQTPPLLTEAFGATPASRASAGKLVLALTWLAWALLLTAIAQPAIVSGEAMRPATGRALVLAVDLSSSMERQDFVLDGKNVDRLIAFKSVARNFVEARQGDRIGLVVFGEEAFSAAPVSYDLAALSNAIEEAAIGMAGRTTAIGDAIGLSIVKLRDDPATESVIVLMSDGANNSGSAEPEDAARLAKERGIRIHAIGMGSVRADNSGSPLDPSADLDEGTLQRVAEISGGKFFRARTTDELAAIYAEIDGLETSEADAPPVTPLTDVRNWALAAIVLVLSGLALARRRA
jgi:Ca-activated chloride channel family protein